MCPSRSSTRRQERFVIIRSELNHADPTTCTPRERKKPASRPSIDALLSKIVSSVASFSVHPGRSRSTSPTGPDVREKPRSLFWSRFEVPLQTKTKHGYLARPLPPKRRGERPDARASRSSTQSGEGRLVVDGDGGSRSVVTGTTSSTSGSTASGSSVGGSTVTSESTSTTSASTATLSGLASRGGSELALDLEEDLLLPLLLLLGGGGLLLLQHWRERQSLGNQLHIPDELSNDLD